MTVSRLKSFGILGSDSFTSFPLTRRIEAKVGDTVAHEKG